MRKNHPRWLGCSGDLRDHAVVGYCVAASFVPGGSGNGVILFRAAIVAYGAVAVLIALGAFGLNLLSADAHRVTISADTRALHDNPFKKTVVKVDST